MSTIYLTQTEINTFKMNAFKITTLLFLLLAFSFSLMAQEPVPEKRNCGSETYMQEMLQNPEFAKEFYLQQEELKKKVTELEAIKAPCTNPILIPVAVHYNTPMNASNTQCLIDAAIAQIDQMNKDYSSCNINADDLCNWIASCPNVGGNQGVNAMPDDGTCIQFCLGDQNLPGSQDNIGGYAITVGDYVWASGASGIWSGYLNLFVSSNATAGHGFGNILGIAPLNGANNPNGNGVFIVNSAFGARLFGACTSGGTLDNGSPYIRGATATHEVGHYFNLDHTFSDNLADTPPQNCPNYGCGSFNSASCTFSGCQTDPSCPAGCSNGGTGYSGNFMDYMNDACMSNFTADQGNRMRASAAPQSKWATNEISCNPVYPPCGASQIPGPCGTTPGPTCYSNLTQGASLPTTENGVADYESSNWIRSTANINSGAKVDYDAANYIQLDGGFRVNGGATFNAFIDGCNNGAGGVNLKDDNPNALNQTDTEQTPTDTEIELKSVNELGKEYIKILKDAAIKQIEGMK